MTWRLFSVLAVAVVASLLGLLVHIGAAAILQAAATAVGPPVQTSALDWTSLLTPIVMALIPALVALAKPWIPARLSVLYPVLATTLGPVADLALASLQARAADPKWGVMMGLAAIGLRELLDQARKIPSGPVVKPVLATLLLLGLTGCATIQQDAATIKADLSAMTNADLDRAIAMASAANPAIDPGAVYRARCYATLKKYVPSDQAVGQALLPNGVVSTLEAAMELDARLRSGVGVPPDVHADCAVLSVNVAEFAGRVGLKLAPVSGLGALPLGPLK